MAEKILSGFFITFEGTEGSGKSTQSQLLSGYVKSKGFPVVYLREPGGTRISEKVRSLLLDRRNVAMSARSEMLLYMASRAQTVEQVIKPALTLGKVVICDRFLDSTLAYQGYGLGMDRNFIKAVGRFATEGLSPRLTFFLDLPIKQGLVHRRHNQDRIEQRPLSYHSRVRTGYLALAKREPARIKVIRVDQDKSVTQRRIREFVDKHVISRYKRTRPGN